ncbi:MAG: hypothetical protein V3S33_02155 [Gammaproteobacteria bacterium]
MATETSNDIKLRCWGLSFQQFIMVISGLGLLLALLLSPELLAWGLSYDSALEPHTVWEIQVWRMMLGFVSISVLSLAVFWSLGKNISWIQRIEMDYAEWVSPVLNLSMENYSWARIGITLAWLVVGLVLVTIWLSFKNSETTWFATLALENGVVESFQALCLLLAGGVLVAQAWRDYRSGNGPFCLVGLLYGLLLVVGAGEEVSWGQHWLGFKTPESLAEVNVQGEFNLHNIGSYWVNHMQMMLFLFYVGI